jgi:hypothetical protein
MKASRNGELRTRNAGLTAAIAAGVVYDDGKAGPRINPRLGVHE